MYEIRTNEPKIKIAVTIRIITLLVGVVDDFTGVVLDASERILGLVVASVGCACEHNPRHLIPI
jgi:hypothetical protein